MTTAKKTAAVGPDIEALTPEPDREPDLIDLSTGSVVRVKRLRTRELFKLLRVITTGGGPLLGSLSFNTDDTEAFATQLIAITVMAIPEAEDQAMEFIRGMIEPAELITPARTKEQKAANKDLEEVLDFELANPEIDDTISVIEAVIRNEAGDIQALGKRLIGLLKMSTPAS